MNYLTPLTFIIVQATLLTLFMNTKNEKICQVLITLMFIIGMLPMFCRAFGDL